MHGKEQSAAQGQEEDCFSSCACMSTDDMALEDEKEFSVKNKENRDKSGKEDGVRNKEVGAAMNDQEATNSS